MIISMIETRNTTEAGNSLEAEKAAIRAWIKNFGCAALLALSSCWTERIDHPTHIIEKGDTLTALADKYDVTVDGIKELNRIKGDKIKVGKELKIPLTLEPIHLESPPKAIYVIKDGSEWKAVKEWTKEGGTKFPIKNWEDHPIWDEAQLEVGYVEPIGCSIKEVQKMKEVKYVILHSTADGDGESVIKDKKAHFLVKDDGQILFLVDPRQKHVAPHAGLSAWGEDKNLNTNSIGIEVATAKGEREKWNEKQTQSVKSLIEWMSGFYRLPKSRFLRHAQVAYDDPSFGADSSDCKGSTSATHKGRGRKIDPYEGLELWDELGLPRNDWIIDSSTVLGIIPREQEESAYDGIQAGIDLRAGIEVPEVIFEQFASITKPQVDIWIQIVKTIKPESDKPKEWEEKFKSALDSKKVDDLMETYSRIGEEYSLEMQSIQQN